MSFNFREDLASATMTTLGVVLIAGGIAFMTLIKKPVGPDAAQAEAQKEKVKQAIQTANESLVASQKYLDEKTWTGTDQDVSPAVLDQATQLAKSRGLTWVALRPQRIDDKQTPIQLPYTAIVDGPFGAVVQYIGDLESPNNKIALSSVMISSSDPASDKVTATIGIVAYQNPKVTAAPVAPTKPAAPATKQDVKHA